MSSTSGTRVPPGAQGDLRVDETLLELLEIPADERPIRLAELCGDDTTLRREVERLLDVDSEWLAKLEVPAYEHLERWRFHSRFGEQVGAFRVGRLLGRGGTSSVFLGHRVEGVGPKNVAIKILGTYLADDEAESRFLREGDILARLSHSNVASIMGGGVCGDGSPFLLLEYVEGVPLDRWCAEANLSIRQRLLLMLTICDAVSYAHAQLIVHRDLKPANILVTSEGVPKLLDFGISKLVDPEAGSTSTTTAFRMLTPEYASPEQLRFSGTGVASDVYSLGVVMFEVLTGRRPFERRSDSESLYRSILERPAPKPSQMCSASALGVEGSDRWKKRLAGDLDAIVLRCLEKSPNDRYGSPQMLASDIGRYLDKLPVKARTLTLTYRLGKLVRRRWQALTFAAVLTAFVGVRLLDLESIRQERDRATAIRDFLVEVMREASPTESRGDDLSLRDVLDQSVGQLDRFDSQPELMTFLLQFYGNIYMTLGELEQGASLLERAVSRAQRTNSEDLPAVLNSWGLGQRELGRPEEAESTLLDALGRLRTMAQEDPLLHFQILQNLGLSLSDQGRYTEAEGYLRAAMELGWQHSLAAKDQAVSLNNLGFCLYGQERVEEALVYFRKSAGLRRQTLGALHPEYALTVSNTAAVALATGRFTEAKAALEQAIAVWRARGPKSPFLVIAQTNLGVAQQSLGEHDGAEESFRTAIDLQHEISGPDHPGVAAPLNNLGNLLAENQRYEEALGYLNESYRIREARLGSQHPDTLAVLWNLLEVELDSGNPRDVDAALKERLESAAADPDMPPDVLREGAAILGRLYRAHGRDAEAERIERRFGSLPKETAAETDA